MKKSELKQLIREEIERLDEAKNIIFDDEEDMLSTNYYKRYGNKGAGGIWPKTWKQDAELKVLNSFDKKLVQDVKLKPNEVIFRYENPMTKAGDLAPLIKINYKKGLVYPLTDNAIETGEGVEFENKGIPTKYMRLRLKTLK